MQRDERTRVELCGIILSTEGPEDKLFPRLKKKRFKRSLMGMVMRMDCRDIRCDFTVMVASRTVLQTDILVRQGNKDHIQASDLAQ